MYVASADVSYDTVNYNEPNIPTLVWEIEKADYDMSGAVWGIVGDSSVYTGNPIKVILTNLPFGVSVSSYENNEYVNVGQYVASATLSYDKINYNQPKAKMFYWEIEKATMKDVFLSDTEATYDTLDFKHSVTLSGNIPKGSTVIYYYNGIVADYISCGGKIAVEAVIENPNYNTHSVTATLNIKVNVPLDTSRSFLDFPRRSYSDADYLAINSYFASLEQADICELQKKYPADYYTLDTTGKYYRSVSIMNGEISYEEGRRFVKTESFRIFYFLENDNFLMFLKTLHFSIFFINYNIVFT